MRRLLVVLALLAAGCAAGDETATTTPPPTDASATSTTAPPTTTTTEGPGEQTVGGERPARLILPAGWEPGDEPRALVVVLHGYSATGSLEDLYLGVSATATDFGYLTLTPDGTTDPGGNRFWNAGGFAGAADDVAYLTALIDEVVDDYGADPDRVFLIGHSNGGFMAHRMACEVPERIAAIATLAGGILGAGEECRRPMRTIVIHGTADTTVPYEGGDLLGVPMLGAVETAARWRTADECAPGGRQEGPFDFDLAVPGAETSVTVWDECLTGATVELWTMEGSGHIPGVFLQFRAALMERLLGVGTMSPQ